jgi:hypothetical protein
MKIEEKMDEYLDEKSWTDNLSSKQLQSLSGRGDKKGKTMWTITRIWHVEADKKIEAIKISKKIKHDEIIIREE